MPKLKKSEWDPLSGGIFKVTVNEKSYLALSRPKAAAWLPKNVMKIAKEKDGYLFFKEPTISSVALFSSEQFACAAYPSLSLGEISKLRIDARKQAEKDFDNIGRFLEPPAPESLDFSEASLAP